MLSDAAPSLPNSPHAVVSDLGYADVFGAGVLVNTCNSIVFTEVGLDALRRTVDYLEPSIASLNEHEAAVRLGKLAASPEMLEASQRALDASASHVYVAVERSLRLRWTIDVLKATLPGLKARQATELQATRASLADISTDSIVSAAIEENLNFLNKPTLFKNWQRQTGYRLLIESNGDPRQVIAAYQSLDMPFIQWVACHASDMQIENFMQWHNKAVIDINDQPETDCIISDRRLKTVQTLEYLYRAGFLDDGQAATVIERIKRLNIIIGDPIVMARDQHLGHTDAVKYCIIGPLAIKADGNMTLEHEIAHGAIFGSSRWENELGTELVAAITKAQSTHVAAIRAAIKETPVHGYTEASLQLLDYLESWRKPTNGTEGLQLFMQYATVPEGCQADKRKQLQAFIEREHGSRAWDRLYTAMEQAIPERGQDTHNSYKCRYF